MTSTRVIAHLKGPFSLTGEVRLQFIDTDMADYLVKHKIPLYSVKDEKTLTPKSYRVVPKGLAFRFLEIPDRNTAETLSKGDLTVPIDVLPEVTEDTYSLDDLIDMNIQKQDNITIATVVQAYNYGASDIIECCTVETQSNKQKTFIMPMSPDTIIDIEFENNRILVTDMIDYFIIA